jgi:hypothetical protein
MTVVLASVTVVEMVLRKILSTIVTPVDPPSPSYGKAFISTGMSNAGARDGQ